jgi:hypothetical protein
LAKSRSFLKPCKTITDQLQLPEQQVLEIKIKVKYDWNLKVIIWSVKETGLQEASYNPVSTASFFISVATGATYLNCRFL